MPSKHLLGVRIPPGAPLRPVPSGTGLRSASTKTMKAQIEKFNIPEEVSRVTKALKDAGFEVYLVGGCVRDLIMGKKPKDWDITTNALPEQIIPLFPKTFYENSFGTVAVVNEEIENIEETERKELEALKVIEITPYRLESGYSDFRRPDKVEFSQNIEDDLKRRDFTINAIAYDHYLGQIVDPYGGVQDLARGVIRCVGNSDERLKEDGLRIIRAIRFHVELGFPIDPDTEKSIIENKDILNKVSRERIRDEFIKIIMSDRPMDGMLILRKLGLIQYIIPELQETFDVEQNKAHAYDVWTHLIKSLQHSADKKFPLHVRLAALLHDISKPFTRRWSEESQQWTFYGHEVVGSRVTKKILENLKFSRETIDKTTNLVRWHMFFSDTEAITLSAVRRMVVNVGKDNVWDLINVRLCDRIGTGRPKENPYRLRKYQAMIDQVMMDPISVGMLKIGGLEIMEKLDLKPGPKIGQILNALLEEVLDDPSLNNTEYLIARARELSKLEESELKSLGQKGIEKREEIEEKEIKKLKDKYKI